MTAKQFFLMLLSSSPILALLALVAGFISCYPSNGKIACYPVIGYAFFGGGAVLTLAVAKEFLDSEGIK